MKIIVSAFAAAVVAAAFAAPTVTVTSIEQDISFNRIKVSYTLSKDAVITWSAKTNSVAVDPQRLTRVWGDVNRKVSAPGGSFEWAAAEELADFFNPSAPVEITLTAWPADAPPDYMVVDCAGKSNVTYYVDAASVPLGVTNDLYKTTKMVLRKIPAKDVTWKMGSPTTETERTQVDGPTYEVRHNVTLTEDYYMGIYPVTQGQYLSFIGSNPSLYNSSKCADWRLHPVERVSYNSIRGNHDVAPWCGNNPNHGVTNSLLVIRNATGIKFDLPTDAQWEYACRAGTSTAFNNGTDSIEGYSLSERVGWTSENSSGTTHAVGLLKPNAWGLYDMHGNTYDWCLDWNGALNTTTAVTDPAGPATKPSHNAKIRRGGSYYGNQARARSAAHGNYDAGSNTDTIGFRLVAPAAGYWKHE